jgi:hypothetical protein
MKHVLPKGMFHTPVVEITLRTTFVMVKIDRPEWEPFLGYLGSDCYIYSAIPFVKRGCAPRTQTVSAFADKIQAASRAWFGSQANHSVH